MAYGMPLKHSSVTKTMNIVVNKNALPKEIAKKLGIK